MKKEKSFDELAFEEFVRFLKSKRLYSTVLRNAKKWHAFEQSNSFKHFMLKIHPFNYPYNMFVWICADYPKTDCPKKEEKRVLFWSEVTTEWRRHYELWKKSNFPK